MKKTLVTTLAALMAAVSLFAQTDMTFTTRQIPVNRGGEEDGTVSLRFYDDMPSVAYISVADFQQLMLPGTTVRVTKTGEGEYTLAGPYADATVNISTEQFSSDDYMAFTNLMGLVQEGMDNVYHDGSPFLRYRSQELSPVAATVSFDFKKYGIDLRGDNSAVFFPCPHSPTSTVTSTTTLPLTTASKSSSLQITKTQISSGWTKRIR